MQKSGARAANLESHGIFICFHWLHLGLHEHGLTLSMHIGGNF